MIIRGILDRSLSNQICIRGFARIKELARISKANKDYQRELIDLQIIQTYNFLTEETYLFFPEVILSLKLKQDSTIPGVKTGDTPIQLIEKNKIFNSNVNSLSIKPIVKKNTKVFDVNEKDLIIVAEIHFDDVELNNLIEANEHPFHRVDGNHRLSAAEQIKGNHRVNMMNIPFCIILFEELTSQRFSPETGLVKVKDDSYEKFERVVFYNINSKSIPLTIEENLKGILGEEKYFSNEDIDKIFEQKGSLARKLGKRIKAEDFTFLKEVIQANKWAMCLQILTLYYKGDDVKVYEDNSNMSSDIYDALQHINIIYQKNSVLKVNPSAEVLIAFLYYKAFSEESKFNFFSKWIINNHLFEANETTAESIIRIFDKIFQRKHVKVFVAMKYWSHQKVTEYNKMFTEALNEVQKKAKSNVELELVPIMRFRGESERIDQRLLNCIKECDVFIADITECNENVMYEVAFAEGCEKSMLLIKREGDSVTPPFDMEKLQWIPYDGDSYYNSIKSIVNINLKPILESKFGIHF
ncbi:MAG: hypothetical protein ACRYFB_11595 [Janthinobacterium lividum]